MTRVLLIEDGADGLLDIGLRAKASGHQVRYFNSKADEQHPTGRGLVERVSDWRGSIRWCDLAVVGGNGKWLKELDSWRREGVPIIGGGEEVAKLELDRLAGMEAFKRMKIPVAPYRHCATLRDAMQYVAERDEGVAVKPAGDNSDKSTSVVGKTAREVLWRLKRWEREGKRFPSGLMVQDRISGVEISAGGWIGPNGFAPAFEEDLEGKRMFAGDLGPNTGEMYSVLRLVKKSKLADKVLKPFEDWAVSTGYCGNLDVNTIVSDDGTPYPLEWTSRCGWPATQIEAALHKDPIDFWTGLLAGDPPNTRELNTVAVGIVLAIPPYPHPYERAEEVVGVPLWDLTPSIEDNMHWSMVMADRDGQLVTSGSYIGVSVGKGETVVQARDEALRVLNRLSIPAAPFWRVDAGSRLRRGLPKLQEHGYALGFSYA